MDSHRFHMDSEATDEAHSMGLTSEGKSVSVGTPGGHEAEDIVRDIIYLSDRLIHLLVEGEEHGRWLDQGD